MRNDDGVNKLADAIEDQFEGQRRVTSARNRSRVTLLDALREHLHLTGTKKGCDHGQCGACTVHVNGRRITRCLTLAVSTKATRSRPSKGWRTADSCIRCRQAFIEHELPVRLLYAGADHVGGRVAPRRVGTGERRNPRSHERQHLPLRRLPNRRRHQAGAIEGSLKMREFEYSVPRDVAGAIDTVSRQAGRCSSPGGLGLSI